MALREYIEIKPLAQRKRKSDFNDMIADILQIGIQSIIPFMCGFYFYKTSSLLFLLVFVFIVFFNVKIRKVT